MSPRTALGHRGGPPVQRRPATIWDVIDAAEEYLNEHGLQRPHLVGNSAGGFVALELARRGRAATVAPCRPLASGRPPTARSRGRTRKCCGAPRCLALATPVGPLIFKSATVRRLALRFLNTAYHGDRLAAARLNELCQDTVGCTVTNELFSTDDEQIAPLDPLPCPITIPHGQRKNSLLPGCPIYGKIARERVPQATFEILPDVNHVPMIDDPELLVARTILAVTGTSKQ